MSNIENIPFKRDIASASASLLKGNLHEAVIDCNEDVVALCGENGKLASLFACAPDLLNKLERALITIQLFQNAARKSGNHDTGIDAEIDSIKATIAQATVKE